MFAPPVAPPTFARFTQHPLRFCVRQLYRIGVVWPFVALMNVLQRLSPERSYTAGDAPYCFFITSIIYPSHKKQVSYGAPRSLFSPEERATQTAATIASIRSRVPGAMIVLVEGGLREDIPTSLKEAVDQYVYVGGRSLVRRACDSTNKSLGEAMMLLCALRQGTYRAAYYFKMSGRYVLNDDFSLPAWGQSGFSFLCLNAEYYSTRLYGFDAYHFTPWKYSLLKGLPLFFLDYPIENTMSKFIPQKKVHSLAQLGLSGIGASSHDTIIE